MKLHYKLIIGSLPAVLLICLVGYLAINASQQVLQMSIGDSTAVLVAKTMAHIDEGIYHKVKLFQIYSQREPLRKAISKSNREFKKIDDLEAYINKKDQEWISPPRAAITPFMRKLLNNNLSQELREHIELYETEYGYRVFSEVFVTNKYGAVIALTGKTTDYLQADEEWYQNTVKEKEFWVGDVEYDKSSDSYACDIVINIYDEAGNFAGVLKAVMNIEEIINIIKAIEAIARYETTEYKLVKKDG